MKCGIEKWKPIVAGFSVSSLCDDIFNMVVQGQFTASLQHVFIPLSSDKLMNYKR